MKAARHAPFLVHSSLACHSKGAGTWDGAGQSIFTCYELSHHVKARWLGCGLGFGTRNAQHTLCGPLTEREEGAGRRYGAPCVGVIQGPHEEDPTWDCHQGVLGRRRLACQTVRRSIIHAG
jgi:hypothetical protein